MVFGVRGQVVVRGERAGAPDSENAWDRTDRRRVMFAQHGGNQRHREGGEPGILSSSYAGGLVARWSTREQRKAALQ
jgi:hypothetical protein